MDELAQVREIAQSLGIKVHPNAKVDTIKAKINQQQAHKIDEVMLHRAEINLDTAPVHTQAAVLEVIEPFTRKEGFTVKFFDDNTWYMGYKGAEDSGHMSVPLRQLRIKAEMVSQGRRSPRAIAKEGDKYNDSVLAVG